TIQVTWRNIGQSLGEPHGRVATHAESRAVGDPVELLADRGIDSRMVVTVDIAPHAAGAVEILAAIDIDETAALGALNNEELVLGHLGERVPIVATVPFAKVVRGGHGWRSHFFRGIMYTFGYGSNPTAS